MLSYFVDVVDECVVEVRNFNCYRPVPCKATMQNHCKAAHANEQEYKEIAD
jgi:hypothetical protein